MIHKEGLLENFWGYVSQAIDQFGDKPLATTKDGILTFRQNNHRANIIAEVLPSHQRGDQFGVGLFLKDPLWIIPAMVGVMKKGLYFIPLDVTFPVGTLHQMFTTAEIRYLLTDNRYLEIAKSVIPEGITLINLEELDYSRETEDPVVNYSPDDIVQIMFTSGSTGSPKGAVENYRYLVRSIKIKLDSKEYAPQDTALQISTFTYSAPHTHTFTALITGTSLYYHDLKEEGFLTLPDTIRRENITLFSSTPTVFRNFLSTLKADDTFPSVRVFRMGGEKKFIEDLKSGHKHFPNVKTVALSFASTETQSATRVTYPIDHSFGDDPLPAGYPREDIRLMIWDEDGNTLPAGEEGEIVIYGDSLARGYINNPELTRKHFVQDPQNPLFQYYKSGDLGKILPDGQLLHLGRIDNMVKIKGIRIELSTLETQLLGYPGIIQVASKAVDDNRGGKKLVSYFVAEPGIEIPISDVRKYLSEKLPAHQLPHFLIQLNEIPLTRNGKVALAQLPLPRMVRPDLPYPYEPPRDELERTLLGIWEENIGITNIGVNDDFFDVGGDSLLGVVLVVAIEEALGKELPVSVLLQAPTVRDQANMIRNEETDKAFSTLIPIRTDGSLPPLFFIPGKGGYPTRIRHLAKALDPEIPVYAMQDLIGYNSTNTGSRKIKSIAALYLNEIKRVAPLGPYVLVGESLGGKICYEMAQQLSARGEIQPLIFMLDTYNFNFVVNHNYEEQRNIAYFMNLLGKHVSILWKSNWKGRAEYFRFYREVFAEQVNRYFGKGKKKTAKTTRTQANFPENVNQMERELLEANREYVVDPYPGRVILIKALRGPYAYDKTNGWDKVEIGKLVTHQLDCYHGSILFEPAVAQLAEIIQKYVRELYKGSATITFQDLSKRYAKNTAREVAALEQISFSVKENEFVSIVGPSGCGKTTLLKIVAKLIKPDTGHIFYEGFEHPSANLVFQDQGVIPWMTVLDNVALGLELKGIPRKLRQQQALDFMKVVRLDGFERYYPHELSGGMRQRVALARAFLTNPDLLLMDEPFGALDAQTRIVLQEELLELWRSYPKTVLFVTHDIDEAILLSDRVIVMSDRPGKIQASIDIPFPRPRDLTQKDDPRFLEIRWKIWNLLEEEVREDIKILQEKRPA